MTIEIHQPKLEALIQQRLNSGRYQDIEDVLLHALTSSLKEEDVSAPGKSLDDVFARIRGLADDVDFSRDRSPDRTIDLS